MVWRVVSLGILATCPDGSLRQRPQAFRRRVSSRITHIHLCDFPGLNSNHLHSVAKPLSGGYFNNTHCNEHIKCWFEARCFLRGTVMSTHSPVSLLKAWSSPDALWQGTEVHSYRHCTGKTEVCILESGQINTKLLPVLTSVEYVMWDSGGGVHTEGGKGKHLYFTPNIEEELDSVMMRTFSGISGVKN